MDLWQNFWTLIWWFVWAFVFIAYLFALFAVITDLFRDRELSGWLKAVWFFFLVFVPFLTALVYVIARGDGMAERNSREARAAREATDAYIRSVASPGPAQEIDKAKQLLDAGTITPEQFEQIKTKALA